MKEYNILKINHEYSMIASCQCKVKSEYAKVEVLFTKIDEYMIKLFKSECKLSESKKISGDLFTESKFFNLPYSRLNEFYDDLIIGNIVVVEVLI